MTGVSRHPKDEREEYITDNDWMARRGYYTNEDKLRVSTDNEDGRDCDVENCEKCYKAA